MILNFCGIVISPLSFLIEFKSSLFLFLAKLKVCQFCLFFSEKVTLNFIDFVPHCLLVSVSFICAPFFIFFFPSSANTGLRLFFL